MTENTEYEPVRMTIAGVEPGVQLGPAMPAGHGKRLVSRFLTVVLTSTNPVQELLPLDDKRVYALCQAGGNDAVVTEVFSSAQNAANQAAGLPNPLGMVLPAGNTVPHHIPGSQRMWCAAAAYPTQVTMCIVQEAD